MILYQATTTGCPRGSGKPANLLGLSRFKQVSRYPPNLYVPGCGEPRLRNLPADVTVAAAVPARPAHCIQLLLPVVVLLWGSSQRSCR